MQEKAAVALRQHDLAWPNLVKGATGNLNYLARPKRGQHAFPENAETHARSLAITIAQSVRH
jgi:hypothetical protein